MSIKDVIGSTVELIVKVVFLVFAATYIMRGATAAYEYGFRVFTEEPVSLGEGRTISVSVEEPVSARDVVGAPAGTLLLGRPAAEGRSTLGRGWL